jgi:hypothetical protein
MGSYSRSALQEPALTEVRTRVLVGPDRRISGVAPADVPPGEHEATITLARPPAHQHPAEPFDVDTLPIHDLGPWPEGLSLRREDMYDEDGR